METIRLTGLGAVQIKQDKLTQLIGLLECEVWPKSSWELYSIMLPDIFCLHSCLGKGPV